MIRPVFLLVLATAATSFVADATQAEAATRPGMGKVVAQKKKKKPADAPPPAAKDAAAVKPASPAPAPVSKADEPAAVGTEVATPPAPDAPAPAVTPTAPAVVGEPAPAPVVPAAATPAAEASAPASATPPSADATTTPPTPPVAETVPVVDAPSDSTDLEALLDSNVVSGASRTAEKADDAPATTTTVTADDMRRYGLRTLAEALNFLSVGMYSQDPLHAVEVGARGVLLSGDYGNHVLLVVDGNIMNEPWNGTAYFEQGAGIPIEMIDHIEVITGAGSVLYGSYAMLGVINVVTKGAKDSKGVHGVLEVSASPPVNSSGQAVLSADGAGGTARIGVNAAQQFMLADKPGEYAIGFEYYRQGGPAFGFAPQYNPADLSGAGCASGTPNYGPKSYLPCVWGGRATEAHWAEVPSLLAKARWGDYSAFLKATQYPRSQPARGVFGITSGDFNSPDSFERDRTLIGELKWQKTLTERVSGMARLYGGTYDYRIDTFSHDWASDGSGDATNVPTPGDTSQGFFIQRQVGVSQWGGLELQSTYDFTEDGRFPLLVGLDSRMRRIGSINDFRDVSTDKSYGSSGRYDRLEWLVAPYVQQRAKLDKEWQLNAGVRIDAQTDFSPALSPRIAAVWTRPSVGIVKAVFSSAFRTPTGYERFTQIPGEQIQNPNLSPERVYTGEVSYERRFGKNRALGGLFVSRFTDMVAFGSSTTTVAGQPLSWFANGNGITNFGFNGLFEGSESQFRYGATLTVASTKADTADGSRDLTLSPTYFGNMHGGYEFPKPFPVVSGAIAFIGSRSADGTYANGASAVWRDGALAPPQVDARFTAVGDVPNMKGLSYRVMMNIAMHNRMPYVVGPQQEPATATSVPALSPVNRFTLMFGAQYDLDVL